MPTVETAVVGVVEKPSGWTRIEIDGRPQFLDTKREDLIAEARQAMREGAVVIIEYSERDGKNINPNTNLPYKDRYFEGIVAGSSNGATRQAEPRGQEPEQREQQREASVGYGYRTHPENAWRMALTSGSERAVQTLPLMPAEQRDFETQQKIALAWALWIMNTQRPGQGFGEESSSQETRARTAYEEPPPPSDEFGF